MLKKSQINEYSDNNLKGVGILTIRAAVFRSLQKLLMDWRFVILQRRVAACLKRALRE